MQLMLSPHCFLTSVLFHSMCYLFSYIPTTLDLSLSLLLPSGKGKIFSLCEEFQVIHDHENGMTLGTLLEMYDLKKSTVHNILKAKKKMKETMSEK